MKLESFTYGSPMRAQVTTNQTWIITGNEEHKCELLGGDYVFAIDNRGFDKLFTFTRVEDDCLVDDKENFIPIRNLVFLGR